MGADEDVLAWLLTCAVLVLAVWVAVEHVLRIFLMHFIGGQSVARDEVRNLLGFGEEMCEVVELLIEKVIVLMREKVHDPLTSKSLVGLVENTTSLDESLFFDHLFAG